MNLATIKTEFEENGFIVIPQIFSPTELGEIDTQTKAYVADIVIDHSFHGRLHKRSNRAWPGFDWSE